MMLKKYLVIIMFATICAPWGGYAASSIRQVGGVSAEPNVAARTGSLRATPGARAVVNKPVVKPNAKPATDTEGTSVSNQRLSAGKYIGSNKLSVSTTNSTNELSGRLDTIENNVQTLQAQTANVITSVVDGEPGTYVTDVSANGNQLNVNKTRLLYAPVRQAESDNITGTAEIWLVK
ncbi:MAG: hypothetical protein K5912_04345 [Alphaproteobacteria bacterium]|nr:hypothetical protein [Alphaproteobacteria bacterium]